MDNETEAKRLMKLCELHCMGDLPTVGQVAEVLVREHGVSEAKAIIIAEYTCEAVSGSGEWPFDHVQALLDATEVSGD